MEGFAIKGVLEAMNRLQSDVVNHGKGKSRSRLLAGCKLASDSSGGAASVNDASMMNDRVAVKEQHIA